MELNLEHFVAYFEEDGGPERWSRGLENNHCYLLNGPFVLFNEKVMPGIPPAYAREQAEGRAIYVLGVPTSYTIRDFAALFEQCGRLDKCPYIIDTYSEQKFHWVIMETAAEADIVLETRNGFCIFPTPEHHNIYCTIWCCRATPPGQHHFYGDSQPSEQPAYEEPPRPKTPPVHAHPKPALPLAPIGPPRKVAPREPPKEDIHPVKDIDPVNTDSRIPRGSTAAAPQACGSSWANIAGTINTDSKTIDLRPESKIRLNPVGRIPSLSKEQQAEPVTEQARLIFLLALPQNLNLNDISKAIQEGPIHTIQFGVNSETRERYAGIIFQFAQDAEKFYQVLVKERVDSTPGRFRFCVEAVRDEHPADNIIKLMGPPTNATRRLTIVKSRFFFMFKEPQFRALCEKEVGADTIQLIWLYNGGNATVVFARVQDAIAVKRRLDKLSLSAEGETNAFYGLQTNFSKDPCVAPLNLISDLQQ